MNASDFLQIMNGDTKSQAVFKLGTIDPTYIEGKPRVIFDGEIESSTKGYCFLSGYKPAAGERILLISLGGTYIILGAILEKIQGNDEFISNPPQLTVKDTADTTYSSNEVTMLNALKSDAIVIRNKLIEVIGKLNKK